MQWFGLVNNSVCDTRHDCSRCSDHVWGLSESVWDTWHDCLRSSVRLIRAIARETKKWLFQVQRSVLYYCSASLCISWQSSEMRPCTLHVKFVYPLNNRRDKELRFGNTSHLKCLDLSLCQFLHFAVSWVFYGCLYPALVAIHPVDSISLFSSPFLCLKLSLFCSWSPLFLSHSFSIHSVSPL